MFGLWSKIEEKGALAIPFRTEALSWLEWAEVSECYPELVPNGFCGYDIYGDKQLIRQCPFVREGDAYKFKVDDPSIGEELNVFVNTRELVNTLCAKDYRYGEDSFFSGLLTCSCGIPDCDGIWAQSVHVSDFMVRWDVCRYKQLYTLFFDREIYDCGVVEMLHDLCRKNNGIDYAVGRGYENRELVVDGVCDVLARHSYYADIWAEYGFAAL